MAEKLKVIEGFTAPLDVLAEYTASLSKVELSDPGSFAKHVSIASEAPQEKWHLLDGSTLETWV